MTREEGVLLIFDEMVTGFRLALGGATEYFGVAPDLVAMGKIIGGGMPIGAYGGREDIMSKVVVDDWGQCATGQYGALRQHVEAGKLTRANLHAELCEIVVGSRPGRESPEETILFWHRGLSLSDIALAHALLEQARAAGVGQTLRFA